MSIPVQLERCSVRYSPTTSPALSEITMEIPAGSCCAILGPTGAGKTTLLNFLSGYIGKHHRSAETSGRLTLGSNHYTSAPSTILFPEVGLVMQDPYVMVSGLHETVREEIGFTLHNLNTPPHEVRERVDRTMESLGLGQLSDRSPSSLSGGEAQRVALASMLVADPPLLLLDEPRNFLDCEGVQSLVEILRALRGKSTILFADYQVELALAVAERVLVLSEGRSVFFGTTEEFLGHYKNLDSLVFSRDWSGFLDKSFHDPRERQTERLLRLLRKA